MFRGLFKKIIIADNLGYLFLTISNMTRTEISILTAWMGILALAFNVYYTLSGFSDMAIGLGKIAGFELGDNFDHPFSSISVTSFVKKWYISFNAWVSYYIIIPLKKSKQSNITKIFVMFLCKTFLVTQNKKCKTQKTVISDVLV